MKLFVAAIVLIGLCVLSVQGQSSRIADRVTWRPILEVKNLAKSKADDDDMEQISAKLALAAAGKLTPDQLEIAIARANRPDYHFGIRNINGMRWLYSAQVVAEYEQTARIKELEDKVADQQKQLGELRMMIVNLQSPKSP